MLTLALCIMILFTYLCMFFNFKYSAHLSIYISQVILGYVVIIIHVGEPKLPIDILGVMS